jgi:hypothetical protein
MQYQNLRLKGELTDAPAARPVVFPLDQENQLVGHISEMAICGFGLTIHDINHVELYTQWLLI